jgi:hypothetical protein
LFLPVWYVDGGQGDTRQIAYGAWALSLTHAPQQQRGRGRGSAPVAGQ